MTHQESADIRLLLEAFGRDWMRPEVSQAYDRLKRGLECDLPQVVTVTSWPVAFVDVSIRDYGEQ